MSIDKELYFLSFESVEHSPELLVAKPEVVTSTEPRAMIVQRTAGRIAVSDEDLYAAFGVPSIPKLEQDSSALPMASNEDNTIMPPFEASPKIAEYVSKALVAAQADQAKIFFSLKELMDFADGASLNPWERHEFKRACKAQLGFDYCGQGQFAVSERLTPEIYWSSMVQVDRVALSGLAEATIAIMEESGHLRYKVAGIMGIVKSQGVRLSPSEYDELFVNLTTHKAVRPLENGMFMLRSKDDMPLEVTFNKVEKDRPGFRWDELKSIDRTFHNQRQRVFKAIHGKGRKRVYQTLTRFPQILHPSQLVEPAAARLERMRVNRHSSADSQLPGRPQRQRSNHARGRAHGKKQTFEQLVAEANNP
jgi:hypothetical protein